MTTETNREKDTTRPYTEMDLFVREQRPGEHDFRIACRMGPNASAGVAEVYGSNVGITPDVARALAHLMAAAPTLNAGWKAIVGAFRQMLLNRLPANEIVAKLDTLIDQHDAAIEEALS
jgi:hypothetical protein